MMIEVLKKIKYETWDCEPLCILQVKNTHLEGYQNDVCMLATQHVTIVQECQVEN